MQELQILLLGPPVIQWQDKPLNISRRIARSMLFYLAGRGLMVTRNELLNAFWGEQTIDKSRPRLRETLSRLRKNLPNGVLVTSNDLVGLNLDKVYIDSRQFDSIINSLGPLPWKLPVDQPLAGNIYQKLLDASKLWRSNRFLAGIGFPTSYELDEWLQYQTTQYEHLYQQVLERLSIHFEARGDYHEALNYAQKAIMIDPLDESLHARVIEILLASGQFDRAQRYYADIEAKFEQEFGTKPGYQLAYLAQQLNKSVPAPDSRSARLNPRKSLDVPFVGRQQVLAQLWHCYRHFTSVFISGEIGIGKTRLLQEFINRQEPSCQIIINRSKPGGMNSPFHSTWDAEREYGHIHRVINKIPALYANFFINRVPELSDMSAERFGPNEPLAEYDRRKVFEFCRYFLLNITEDDQILFIIEDIQWSDLETFEAINYVITRAPMGSKAMIIMTGRSEECSPEILKYIHSWKLEGLIRQIELKRFTLPEVHSLTNTALARLVPPQFADQLFRDTGGNPYFILQTLREVIETLSDADLTMALPLPISSELAILIRSRLESITPEARDLLDVAAIIGGEFDPQVAQHALKIDRQNFEQVLAEVESGGMVEIRSDAIEVCYGFIQEKFREYLLSEMKPLRKQALHRQVADALIAIYGENASFSLLAYHTEQSGDRVKSFELWLTAGLNAYHQNHIDTACDLFSKAANLVDQENHAFTPETLYRLYQPWLGILHTLNDMKAYQQVCADMLDLGEQRGSSLLIGSALCGQAWAHIDAYELDQGLRVIRQALSYLERVPNELELVNAYNAYATLLYMTDQIGQSMAVFQDALSVVENIENPSPSLINASVYTHDNISILYEIRGMPALSRQHAQTALSGSIHTQNMFGQISAYGHLVFAYYYLGLFAQAQMYTDFGVRLAGKNHHERMLGFYSIYGSWIDLATGNLSGSLQHAHDAHLSGIRSEMPLLLGLAERCFADVCLRLKQFDLALKYYQKGLTFFPHGIARQDILWRMGYAYVNLGQLDQASTAFQGVVDYADQVGADMLRIQAQLGQIKLLLLQESYDAAWQLAERVRSETERNELNSMHIQANLLLGKSAYRNHQSEVARTHLELAGEDAMLCNCIFQEITARVNLTLIQKSQDWEIGAQNQRIQYLLEQLESSILADIRFPDGELLIDLYRKYCQNIEELSA